MMTHQHETPPKSGSMQWRWQKVARRIRVPLGFVDRCVYLVEVARRARIQLPSRGALRWFFPDSRCARLLPAR
jgi:hypothetical protein